MKPTNVKDLQDIILGHPCLLPVGSRSKTALSAARDGVVQLDLSGLSGMLEYQPDEFTFTALAGTQVGEVERLLSEHGQYLPFDPLLVERGATLGGVVASGLSGPGRYRYGGVRDFLLGVRFVDGHGALVRGGGKVVKNAAGFDLPKLMVGSLGGYGALVELTFKVFPRPPAFTTVKAGYASLPEAVAALTRLTQAPLDLFALDLESDSGGASLLVRLGGLERAFPQRRERVRQILGCGEALEGDQEVEIWRAARELTWAPEDCSLVKVPVNPARLLDLDSQCSAYGAPRRYSAGANLAWVAWSGPVDALDGILSPLGLSGLVVRGSTRRPRLGVRVGESFARRVKQALDPAGRWMEV